MLYLYNSFLSKFPGASYPGYSASLRLNLQAVFRATGACEVLRLGETYEYEMSLLVLLR